MQSVWFQYPDRRETRRDGHSTRRPCNQHESLSLAVVPTAWECPCKYSAACMLPVLRVVNATYYSIHTTETALPARMRAGSRVLPACLFVSVFETIASADRPVEGIPFASWMLLLQVSWLAWRDEWCSKPFMAREAEQQRSRYGMKRLSCFC